MAKSNTKYYWWCQIVGWSVVILAFAFFAYTYQLKITFKLLERQFVFMLTGILTTHIFRMVIRRLNWMMQPVEKVLPKLFFGVIACSLAIGLIQMFSNDYLGFGEDKRKLVFSIRLLSHTLDNGMFIIPWTMIYYFYHYIDKSRKQQFDTLKLESLVKELELKTIKSHINPHFIFNALNSIRALIDENPGRARTAITELSNILRSSMQTEKQETVSFEKELDIVKDYLALEYIRFEDRLQVEYDIDEETLDQPIPPMMLQTLVENAIKHGISKQLQGGKVLIISEFRDRYHALVIRNTGHLKGSLNGDGFGLVSTRNRLQLLFGEKANFDIKEINGNTVEATVLIPRTINKILV
jgi:two-component system LytT family sensor kinase